MSDNTINQLIKHHTRTFFFVMVAVNWPETPYKIKSLHRWPTYEISQLDIAFGSQQDICRYALIKADIIRCIKTKDFENQERYQMTAIPLMSLCTFFVSCKYSNPFRTSRSIMQMNISSNVPGRICITINYDQVPISS
jgi:hypothetical protein